MTNYEEFIFKLQVVEVMIKNMSDKLNNIYNDTDDIASMLIIEMIKTHRHLAQLLYLLEKNVVKEIVERGLKDEQD